MLKSVTNLINYIYKIFGLLFHYPNKRKDGHSCVRLSIFFIVLMCVDYQRYFIENLRVNYKRYLYYI